MDEVTGILDDWIVDPLGRSVIWGHIRNDKAGRFRDGDYIHTSFISLDAVGFEALKEGDMVYTRNSYYLLGTKAASF